MAKSSNGRPSRSGRRAGRKDRKLLIIGGAEERKKGERTVLRRFVELAGGGRARVLVCAAATEEPDETLDEYDEAFRSLGVKEMLRVSLRDREEASEEQWVGMLDRATAVFLTGGDQLRLTSMMAGTPFCVRMKERYQEGLFVAGTSAGAAAMSSTMIVRGEGNTVRRSDVQMAPGLTLLDDTSIDTHFDRSGRLHRMMSIIAQNPATLGIGLDEDTAIEVTPGVEFRVLGSGVVMVFDGHISHTNTYQVGYEDPMALTDVAVHVLPAGYGFSFRDKRPILATSAEKASVKTSG